MPWNRRAFSRPRLRVPLNIYITLSFWIRMCSVWMRTLSFIEWISSARVNHRITITSNSNTHTYSHFSFSLYRVENARCEQYARFTFFSLRAHTDIVRQRSEHNCDTHEKKTIGSSIVSTAIMMKYSDSVRRISWIDTVWLPTRARTSMNEFSSDISIVHRNGVCVQMHH